MIKWQNLVKQAIMPLIEKKYKLLTRDYAAFQTRLCAADSAIDPEGIDKTLYNIYQPGSAVNDLHTITAYNMFFTSTGNKIFDVEDENGKHWIGQPKQLIETKRGQVMFSELKESDEIVGFVEG